MFHPHTHFHNTYAASKRLYWQQTSHEIAQKELSIYSIDLPHPVPYCSQDDEVMSDQ